MLFPPELSEADRRNPELMDCLEGYTSLMNKNKQQMDIHGNELRTQRRLLNAAADDRGKGDANFINRRVSRKGVFRHE